MKSTIINFLCALTIGTTAAVSGAALALASEGPQPICGPMKEVKAQLEDEFRAVRRFVGIVSPAVVVEVYLNEGTGVFAFLVHELNGRTCFLAYGTDGILFQAK